MSGISSAPVGLSGRVLSGLVNPNRWDTVYLFEWGQTVGYGSSTIANQIVSGLDNQDHPVNTEIGGLAPGTAYHFRIVATNFSGTTFGPDQTFVTPGPPTVAPTLVSAVGTTSAHFSTGVIAAGAPTSLVFQYGSAAYELSTPAIFAGQEMFSQPFGTDVVGLAPGTTYHVRAVASNALGNAIGTDIAFTTQPLPVSVKPKPKRHCKKGKVKRKGKCVKKHKKKHKKKKSKHHRRLDSSNG